MARAIKTPDGIPEKFQVRNAHDVSEKANETHVVHYFIEHELSGKQMVVESLANVNEQCINEKEHGEEPVQHSSALEKNNTETRSMANPVIHETNKWIREITLAANDMMHELIDRNTFEERNRSPIISQRIISFRIMHDNKVNEILIDSLPDDSACELKVNAQSIPNGNMPKIYEGKTETGAILNGSLHEADNIETEKQLVSNGVVFNAAEFSEEQTSQNGDLQDGSDNQTDYDDVCQGNSVMPIDRGWSWIVLAASWCNMFILLGTYRTFGVMFVEIQNRFDSSSSATALIPSLLNATYSVTALLVTTVGLRYFSDRQFIMCGGIVLSSSYILSAFSTNVGLLLLLVGCMSGIGHGMTYAPTVSLLSQYFYKYRSLANCIAFTGGGVGSLVLSVAFPVLVEEYAFSGALLFLAGLTLQILVSGSVMRPTSFYSKNTINTEWKDATAPNVEDVNGIDGSVCEQSTENNTIKENRLCLVKDNWKSVDLQNLEESKSLLDIKMSPLLLRVGAARNSRPRTMSELSKSSLAKSIGSRLSMLKNSSIVRYASTELSVVSIVDLTPVQKSQDIRNGGDTVRCCLSCKYFNSLRSMIDCGAMKKYAFRCYLPFSCMLVLQSSVMIFLPALAKDTGLSSKKSSLLVTIVSVIDMTCIILWGLFADKGYLIRNKLVSFSSLAVGIIVCFTPLLETYMAFVTFSVIYGVFGRVFFSLYPVMLVDFIGIENLRSAMGIVSPFQTISTAVFQPLIGMLRDTNGSYIPGMLLMGALIIVGALGILLMPCAEKWEIQKNGQSVEELAAMP